MPGHVYRGLSADWSAVWKEGSLYDRDGVTPLIMKRPGGWAIGNAAAVTWRLQGNTFLKAPSSESYCRIVQGQVLKGAGYEVLYRLVGDGITRANGREVVLRGAGLTAEELVLAALVLERL